MMSPSFLLKIVSLLFCLFLTAETALPSLSQLTVKSFPELSFLNDSNLVAHLHSRPFQAYITGILLSENCCTRRGYISKEKVRAFIKKLALYESDNGLCQKSLLYQAVYNFCLNYLDLKEVERETDAFNDEVMDYDTLVRKELYGEEAEAVPFGYLAMASFVFNQPQFIHKVDAFVPLAEIPQVKRLVNERCRVRGIRRTENKLLPSIGLSYSTVTKSGFMKYTLKKTGQRIIYKISTTNSSQVCEVFSAVNIYPSDALYITSPKRLEEEQLWMLQKYSKGEFSEADGLAVKAYIIMEMIEVIPSWKMFDIYQNLIPDSIVSQAFFISKVFSDCVHGLSRSNNLREYFEAGIAHLLLLPDNEEPHLRRLNVLKTLCVASIKQFPFEQIDNKMLLGSISLGDCILESFSKHGNFSSSAGVVITFLAFKVFFKYDLLREDFSKPNGRYYDFEQMHISILRLFPEIHNALHGLLEDKKGFYSLRQFDFYSPYPNILCADYIPEGMQVTRNDYVQDIESTDDKLVVSQLLFQPNGEILHAMEHGSQFISKPCTFTVIFPISYKDDYENNGIDYEKITYHLYHCSMSDANSLEVTFANAFLFFNKIGIIRYREI